MAEPGKHLTLIESFGVTLVCDYCTLGSSSSCHFLLNYPFRPNTEINSSRDNILQLSDDDSYMEHSSRVECCDSEESLVDDYEIHEDCEDRSSDEDEFNFNAALQDRVSRRESDGYEKGPPSHWAGRKLICNPINGKFIRNPPMYSRCKYQQTSTPAEFGNRSTGRTHFYKPVRPSGFGIMVDEDSGRSVYNPGLRTEKVIEEGTPRASPRWWLLKNMIYFKVALAWG
ncbi:hypothetical protein K1719_019261 [Acacia pycnantha]|nr:hypothetical protein K1719_019261 [Acacia pycnantha]